MSELPRGWIAVQVGDVLEGFESGRNLQAEGRPAVGNEYGVLKVSAVTWGEFKPEENKALLKGDAPRPHEIVRRGDVLISRANTTELVGAPVIVEHDHPQLMLPDKILRLVPLHDLVDSPFLVYALRTPAVRNHFEAEATGTSDSMRNLSQPKIAAAPLVLPPVGEQLRIVTKIKALSARSRRAKAALDAIPPLLERFRQSVLAAAFRGDLTADWREKHPDVEPAEVLLQRIRAERRRRWEEAELARMKAKGKAPGDDRWKDRYEEPAPVNASELPELPEGWCWASWAEIGFCQNGRPFPSSDYSTSGAKLLRPGNLHVDGGLEWTSDNTKYLPERHELENPDHIIQGDELLMNLTAQSLKDEFLGRVCLSSPGERCLLNQRLARLTPVGLSVRFCLWLFKAPLVRGYIDELNTGSLIQHMFTSQVDRFALPIPPAPEQAQIVTRIETILSSMKRIRDSVRQGNAQLGHLDRSILAKAFRGELVPQDPSDEPASVLLERLRAERAAADAGAGPARRAGRKRKVPSPAVG